jgi:hypothetical protein
MVDEVYVLQESLAVVDGIMRYPDFDCGRLIVLPFELLSQTPLVLFAPLSQVLRASASEIESKLLRRRLMAMAEDQQKRAAVAAGGGAGVRHSLNERCCAELGLSLGDYDDDNSRPVRLPPARRGLYETAAGVPVAARVGAELEQRRPQRSMSSVASALSASAMSLSSSNAAEATGISHSAFSTLDANQDGHVDFDELARKPWLFASDVNNGDAATRSENGDDGGASDELRCRTAEQLLRFFDSLVGDGDGRISRTDFLMGVNVLHHSASPADSPLKLLMNRIGYAFVELPHQFSRSSFSSSRGDGSHGGDGRHGDGGNYRSSSSGGGGSLGGTQSSCSDRLFRFARDHFDRRSYMFPLVYPAKEFIDSSTSTV